MIKSSNRFQGDPAIKITSDGATMKFIGGQPIMDVGFENAVQISLFTKKGWWGNILFPVASQKIGSDYEKQCNEPIVSLSSINNVTDAADKALAWMKEKSIASKIDNTVTNPNSNNINMKSRITPLGSDSEVFIFSKNGMNWIGQIQNPAFDQFPEVN